MTSMKSMKNMKIVMMIMIMIMIFLMIIQTKSLAGIRLKSKLSPSSVSSSNTDTYAHDSERRILPKRGDVAVIVEGDDRQHIAIAEAMIIEELINRGYRVVDEAKMKRIKMAAARAKAAQYAWEGNIAGLLKLNGNYSVSATILARVRAEYPRLNEYELYTGTSSIVLMAVAGPKKLGGRLSDGRSIGYSIEEAMRKSLYEAVQKGMQQFF